MKIISPKIHGLIDYVVVMSFLASPILLGLPHYAGIIAYLLGFVHLSLTMLTKYQFGVFKVIPLPIHGWIELIVSFALVIIAFYLGSLEGDFAKFYYVGFAVAVFITWLLSDYNGNTTSKNV